MVGTNPCDFCSAEVDPRKREEHNRWHLVHGLHNSDCDKLLTELAQKTTTMALYPQPCSCGLEEPTRDADQWPRLDSCSECFSVVKLVTIDLKAHSASGWAEGDPIYVHTRPVNKDKPELCFVTSEDHTASTNLRDVGEE